MNQFIVFAGEGFGLGGYNDYRGESSDLAKAKELAESIVAAIETDAGEGAAWAHVVDHKSRKVVWKHEAKAQAV